MMPDQNGLEVFQDLRIEGDSVVLARFREVVQGGSGDWVHDQLSELRMASTLSATTDILAFVHSASGGLPAARLSIWRKSSGYEVTNIVPEGFGELGISRYNRLLQDFADRVAQPAAQKVGARVILTKSRQDLGDWMPSDAASALRLFSAAANKSTGSGHPLDRARWYLFIIAAHRASEDINSENIVRWLIEVESWPEDIAHKLAGQYEFGLGILEAADRHHD